MQSIHSVAGLQEIFPAGSIIPAYRRTKNLEDLLAPSRLKVNVENNNANLGVGGCIKCKRKCDLCTNYLVESDRFTSLAMGRFYKIKQALYCTSTNVVYLASCRKCKLQYVGSTSNQFKVRFRNHKSVMNTGKNTCKVAIHFNNTPHSLTDFEFTIIEKIINTQKKEVLLIREAYWAAQLGTLQPTGLNERCEYRTTTRINYNK